jgi:cell fate (sporulation/competence/biofilm development) regulator YlbF (YheA/YmcA/DUF963 family)
MKTIVDKVDRLDAIIRQFEKMISKMHSGQFIFAYRDANRLLAEFKADRKVLIEKTTTMGGQG